MPTIKELSNLSGRRALITGATGRLGQVFADTLAELGADLVLVDRQGSDFKSLNEDLQRRWEVDIENHTCDLENQAERQELIEKLTHSGLGLNILINNAAFVGTSEIPGWSVPFEVQSIETWRRAIEVNLTAVFDISRGMSPLLKASKSGCVINIASIYGMYGPDWGLYEGTSMSNPAAYAASKGGLIQLTRWLATTVAPDVRVNSISPGGIFRGQPEEFVNRYKDRTPLGRMANEEDFRGVIAYLSSDLSQYVTGINIPIDGGWGVW
jgi:NAD(P)-dependent dehydrogenase (short-subunit alcohol dehydrogenase family)